MAKKRIPQTEYPTWIVCALLILVGVCQPLFSAHLMEKNFRKLTFREKMLLKHFFETAIKTDQLGHVLFFATKPTSFFIS